VAGHDVHRLARRARRRAVALVPEAFDDLLFATTVAEECRLADRRASRPGTAELFARLLGADSGWDARALMTRHPRDLSAGERLCLALAIQLSVRPRVLLVDEPSRGLDAAARRLVGAVLQEAAASGAAVIFATHDRAFAARYATRTITMAAGRLEARVVVS
jgi:energy-coupling factor transport system ATP-binding protein